MTCIAGLVGEKGNSVYVASDSETTWGWEKHECGSKVFKLGKLGVRKNNVALFAWTGPTCVPNFLERRMSLPDVPEDDEDKWLYVLLPDAIRKTLSDMDLVKDGTVRGGGALIIGWRGRLISMDRAFSMVPATRSYVAHGSGGPVALGSLFSTSKNKTPKERLRLAVQAAQTWSVGVGGSVHIESL